MFFLYVAACLILDQGSKYLVRLTMEPGQSIPLIDGFFHLTYVLNDGAAFSLMRGQRWFFLMVTLLAVGFIVYYLRSVPKGDKLTRLSLALFCGGALGNFIDRLLYGKVVDFFDFRFFPVFNIADCCLVVGCILLCVSLLRSNWSAKIWEGEDMEEQIFLWGKAGQRLDRYLAESIPILSRSHLQNLIKTGQVLVDGQPAGKTGLVLTGEEKIAVTLPEPELPEIKPENIPLDILYEDADIIVVNKPQGMVVHPAAGHSQGTLVNALLYHCGDLSGINGVSRPGIVHRIDKDTSGVLVVAKNDAAHQGLAAQWKTHDIKRVYQAILLGVLNENAGVIDAPVGRHPRDRKKMAVETVHGREAITRYQVLRRFAHYTYVELTLETGRTHQIRVHMAHLGHPVLGDPVYGPKKQPFDLQGQVLHAKYLSFKHPITGQPMEFDSPLPDYFQKLLKELEHDV